MSIIGSVILNQSITEKTVNTPAEALSFLDGQLSNNLNSINDGMDISFYAINQSSLMLQYAGANNSIYIVRQNKLIEIKSDKIAIGGNNENGSKKVFTNHVYQLEKNDCIYLFTDGFADRNKNTQSGSYYDSASISKYCVLFTHFLLSKIQKHLVGFLLRFCFDFDN